MNDEDKNIIPSERDEDPPENVTVPGGDRQSRVRPGFKLIYQWLILLIIIVLCWLSYFNLQQIERVDRYSSTAIDEIQTHQQAISESLTAINDMVTELQNEQKQQADRLASAYRPDSNQDWGLAEVEYLLVIAMHRLLLERDLKTAIVAMEAADLRLKGMGDPDLLLVRQQLFEDLNKLRAVKQTDISSLAVYLSSIINIADGLPLRSSAQQQRDAPLSETESVPESAEQGLFKRLSTSLWQELKSLLIIRRAAQTEPVLLLPKEEFFLRQNLKLQLEIARQSILRADGDNLQVSVDLMQSWLQQYFDDNDPAVINILETLQKIRTVELQPELPDISSSLESLRAVRHAERQSNR